MRASIVIASCNEGTNLEKTVRSCLETTADLDAEIVVADDASTDGSPEAVKRRFPQVRLARHAERRGVSQTKDLGARWARGEVLVFLDAHCKPEPGAVERLVAGVEELDGDAVLSPRIANLDVSRWENDLDQVGHGYAITLESFDVWWVPFEAMTPHAATRFYLQPTFIGCVVAMSHKLYDRLWGFDTGMLVYGAEDTDFGVKAWLMGHPVLHDPEPVIGHRFRQDFDNYVVPSEHILCNQLRMARKAFSDPVWFDWLARFSSWQPADLWERGWRQYLAGHESVERERAYLMANRVHDEFWYARTFGQSWPLTSPPCAGPERQRDRNPFHVSYGGSDLPLTPQQGAAGTAGTARRGTLSPSPRPLRNAKSPSPGPFRSRWSPSPAPLRGPMSPSPGPCRSPKSPSPGPRRTRG
jgi:GT2 family glycosyltransferase